MNYTQQIGKALEAAHGAGIIHRDLKPANVMLCQTEDGRETIKILDFGIAKINDNTGSFATRTGAMIGTCNSMAPEQVLGQSIDARTDIYAVGILLYYLLKGKYPFHGKTISSILYQHVHARATPIEETLGEPVPLALNQLILKCLEKERSDRFKNMKKLLKALDAVGVADDDSGHTPQLRPRLRDTLPKDHPRRLSAALRWRYRWLRGEMPTKIRELCSWLPELFHGNFRYANLDKDAPGIFGYHLPVRDISHGFEVVKPPRLTAPALFRDVLALAIVPDGQTWELAVFPSLEPRAGADTRVKNRLKGIKEFFEDYDVPITCRLVDLNEPYECHEVRNRLAIFGALLAGSLPPAFWATVLYHLLMAMTFATGQRSHRRLSYEVPCFF